MYRTCPQCQHTREDGETGDSDVCPACGLVFSKWMRNRYRDPQRIDESKIAETGTPFLQRLWHTLAYVPSADGISFSARLVIFIIFLIWGGYFLSLGLAYEPIGSSFMHNINLVFHEAGHVIFRLFGDFMMILGGSLFQILVPLILGLALLIKNHDTFGASIGLWWTGQSMVDVSPYIDDARSLSLPLLGGGTGADRPGMHDWRNILLDLNMIDQDHVIAKTVMFTGKTLIVMALLWAAFYLVRQRKLLE